MAVNAKAPSRLPEAGHAAPARQPEQACDDLPCASLELLRLKLCASLASGRGIVLLTGAAGAGKTHLLRMAMQDRQAPAHIASLSFTALSGPEILQSISYAFGMPQRNGATPSESWLHEQLKQWTRNGEAALLIIDEAQSLTHDALVALLRLHQAQRRWQGTLRMIWVGQTALLQRLNAPALQAFVAELGPSFQLAPLPQKEADALIRNRLTQLLPDQPRPEWTPAALDAIRRHTQGYPGRIRLLCQQMIQLAWLMDAQPLIEAHHVIAQANELGFAANPQAPSAAAPANWGEVPATAPAPVPAAVAAHHSPRTESISKPKLNTSDATQRRCARVGAWTGLLALATLSLGVLLHRPTADRWAPTPALTATPRITVAIPSGSTPTATHNAVHMAQPIAEHAAPEVATFTAEVPVPQATAPVAMQMEPTAAVATRPTAQAQHASAECSQLLVRWSLGETLSTQDRLTLESQCR
ncbi:ExeA family protein [Roseateles koreensis]|uniref:AAA family ATPase n=1 Tax=Roseateles koreensis TaxID=2987526 RepID=A0ABT5KSC3_9BURK|nr:AAA family ATPase [Roseateles koreensis]MDC8785731.1 AAA family ATPase [Roseateles koreensis]